MSHAHPELGTPPELPANGLRIIPLGGLGDIGRNMTVFEHADRLMIVDVGVLFPEDAQPGVDLILPDFELVRDRLDSIEAIVLTHAHEDHIGAVPYLLRERQDIPVYGSRLTLALLESKLREHRIKATTHEVVEGEVVQAGPFSLEFVAVNHSIPDALAVFIETAAGTVLYTGDFKLDQLPLDGRITDLRAFARLGERGVDLFMVDSTNAEVPGFVASERDLEPAIDRVFNNARGRIVVASFASHIHRIQQIIDVAHRHHRKIAFFGRSMVRNMGVASDLGYLEIPGGILVSSEQLSELPDHEVVLICTGSQGEPMAALSRIANNDHQIKIGPGDTVVLASSLIPGNENAVSRVINGLTRLGAKVVHKGNAMVHVSGHAAAGELLYCYNIVRPRNVMPIHGEPRHLKANAELALATGIPAERIVLTLDGGVVDLVDGRATVTGAVPCGYVYVDGVSVGDLTEASLKDRRVLGSEGFITCFVVIDSVEGKVTAGPEIQARGFVEDEAVFDDVLPRIKDAVEEALRHGNTDQYALQQLVRRTLGRWVNDQHRRRPMIVPVVVEA